MIKFVKSVFPAPADDRHCYHGDQVINIQYFKMRKLTRIMNGLAASINSICRRIGKSGNVFAEDIAEIKVGQEKICSVIKECCGKQFQKDGVTASDT